MRFGSAGVVIMKNAKSLSCAILIGGCAQTVADAGPWQTKATDFAGYVQVAPDEAAALIARARTDFRASPVRLFPDDEGARPLLLRGVARRPDGTTLLAFYMDGVSDMYAMYVFNARGEIIDRYVHSFWGVIPTRRRTGRR